MQGIFSIIFMIKSYYSLMRHPSKRKIKRLRNYIKLSGIVFSRHSSFWAIIFGFGLILIGLILFLWSESFDPSNSIKADKVGQLGDFIGGIVGSIWALAGVILFYVALTTQKRELKLQRQEFRLQRQELSMTRSVFEKQSKLIQLQQRENTFFNLLENLKVFVNSLKQKDDSDPDSNYLTGHEVLTSKWRGIRKKLIEYKYEIKEEIYIDTVNKTPIDYLLEDEELGLIYSNIAHLVHFVYRELENKSFYHDTVFNNLSVIERLIIGSFTYYNIGKRNYELNFTDIEYDYISEFTKSDIFVDFKHILPKIQLASTSMSIHIKDDNFTNNFPRLLISIDSIGYTFYEGCEFLIDGEVVYEHHNSEPIEITDERKEFSIDLIDLVFDHFLDENLLEDILKKKVDSLDNVNSYTKTARLKLILTFHDIRHKIWSSFSVSTFDSTGSNFWDPTPDSISIHF